ncbi:MAG: hypothetical protein RLZZ308_271 [Candidatus Parcubacteria bacterium]|jgi:hypothetical protein
MAFSFNPTSGQQDGGASQSPAFASSAVNPQGIPLSDAPQAPDSPFLFMQHRDGAIPVNGYIQIVLIVICVLSVVSAGTLFVYGKYLESSIEEKKQELAQKESSFKEYPFSEMKRLSDRAASLDQLLKTYVSVRSPLKFLEDVVERRVYFNDFTLTKEKKGGYVASFTAVTNDYQSLIQQLEALKLTQYTKVAPPQTQKLDKFTEDKKKSLKVKVTTPVFVQGVLPDQVVFIDPASAQEPSDVSSVPAQSAQVGSTTSALTQ